MMMERFKITKTGVVNVGETGVEFNARDFARSLENIGRNIRTRTVSGYVVDGVEVNVGELEEYVRDNGGENIEVIY